MVRRGAPLEGSSLSPFRHAAFTVLWVATVVSNIGTWMQSAAAWLMTILDPDPRIVALVQVAASLPILVCSPGRRARGHRGLTQAIDRQSGGGHAPRRDVRRIGMDGTRSAARPDLTDFRHLKYGEEAANHRKSRQLHSSLLPASCYVRSCGGGSPALPHSCVSPPSTWAAVRECVAALFMLEHAIELALSYAAQLNSGTQTFRNLRPLPVSTCRTPWPRREDPIAQ